MSLKKPLSKHYGLNAIDGDDVPMPNPAYERVEVYQTADGKQHPTPKKAEEHVADQCREILDERIKHMLPKGHLTSTDRYRVIMQLIPDAAAARVLAGELGKVFIE